MAAAAPAEQTGGVAGHPSSRSSSTCSRSLQPWQHWKSSSILFSSDCFLRRRVKPSPCPLQHHRMSTRALARRDLEGHINLARRDLEGNFHSERRDAPDTTVNAEEADEREVEETGVLAGRLRHARFEHIRPAGARIVVHWVAAEEADTHIATSTSGLPSVNRDARNSPSFLEEAKLFG